MSVYESFNLYLNTKDFIIISNNVVLRPPQRSQTHLNDEYLLLFAFWAIRLFQWWFYYVFFFFLLCLVPSARIMAFVRISFPHYISNQKHHNKQKTSKEDALFKLKSSFTFICLPQTNTFYMNVNLVSNT